MVPGRLSVIIPFCNEHPQAAFTIQNIRSELMGAQIDHEIIAIDNWCDEVAAQNRVNDGGSAYLERLSRDCKQFTYLQYQKKLSHWNAKNAGVRASTGEFLWFVDAHCLVKPGSLSDMYRHYLSHHKILDGTLHMPITYMLDKPDKKLIYSLVTDLPKGIVHYTFASLKDGSRASFPVPCMSTCGMMMTREIYDLLGGWPTELGIYGGGENFINFTLAILRKSINIFPTAQLFHYAAPRGYEWNYLDFHRNRCISSFMYGGEFLARTYMRHVNGSRMILEHTCDRILSNARCIAHRRHIMKNQKTTIEDWVAKWSAANS